MVRKELNFAANIMDTAIALAEGNPGAAVVMGEILREKGVDSIPLLRALDDMNMRGTQIWVGYSGYCGQDLNKFIALVESRDQGMIDKINEKGLRGNHREKAVQSGASGMKQRPMLDLM